jgi:glycosyltransferase involved in cell wall biosynthesis
VIIGDGPEREPLARLAAQLGVAARVELAGQLPHAQAMSRARAAHVFVMPSVDEAFGVVYVEAMAAGLPAIGARGEAGPQEIAGVGGGLRLVAPGDVEALAAEIEGLITDPQYAKDLGEAARETVLLAFTWEACGRATVAAYQDALR